MRIEPRKTYKITEVADSEHKYLVGYDIVIESSRELYAEFFYVRGKVDRAPYEVQLVARLGKSHEQLCVCDAYNFPHAKGATCKAVENL